MNRQLLGIAIACAILPIAGCKRAAVAPPAFGAASPVTRRRKPA